MRQPELPYDGDGWTYYTGGGTIRDGVLVAGRTVYRIHPRPDGYPDEDRLRPFRWEPASTVSDHFMGRSDPGENWWEIPTSEARARVEEANAFNTQNLARWTHLVVTRLTEAGHPEIAERIRTLYQELREDRVRPWVLHDLLSSTQVPAIKNSLPEDQRQPYSRAYHGIGDITRDRFRNW